MLTIKGLRKLNKKGVEYVAVPTEEFKELLKQFGVRLEVRSLDEIGDEENERQQIESEAGNT